MSKILPFAFALLLIIPAFSASLTRVYADDYPHDPRGEITDVVIYPSLPSYQGETPLIYVEFHNPTATTYHYLVVVNIYDSNNNVVYDSHLVGEDIDGNVGGGNIVSWGPWEYTIPSDAAVGTWHILAGLRLYPWEPELDYRGLSWCEPEETFTVNPSHETIEGASGDPYDYDGDGYSDSVRIQVLAQTNALEDVDVEAYGDLKDPYGNVVDNDGSGLWMVPAGGQSWGFPFYLFVPGGSPVGTYTVDLYLYDETHRNNYPDPEDVVLDAISIGPLYPPGYDPYQPLHLESDEDIGATVDLGSISIDGTPFSLPTDLSAEIGGYTVEYSSASGYFFDHWETTGGISVSNQDDNPTTMTVNVPGGTLRAVYAAELYWQFSAPYSLGDTATDGGGFFSDAHANVDQTLGKIEVEAWSLVHSLDTPYSRAWALALGLLGFDFDAPLDGVYEITMRFQVNGDLEVSGVIPFALVGASVWLEGHVLEVGEEIWYDRLWQRGISLPQASGDFSEYVEETFTLYLQMGNYQIFGSAMAWTQAWGFLGTGEAFSDFNGGWGVWLEEIEIRLVHPDIETGSLTVSIFDSTGAPMSGEELDSLVIFQDAPDNTYEIVDPITSNSHTWSALPSGHSYLIEAYVNDMYSGSTEWIAIESPRVSKSVSIITHESSFLKVKTTFSDGITPLPDAYVEIYSHKSTLWRSGDTDSNGETTWFSLQPTTVSGEFYQVSVFYDGDQVGATEGVILSSSEWTVQHMTTTVDPPNAPPVVSNGYVTPASGTTSTLFSYYVDYYDPNGDSPTQRDCVVDGAFHQMMLVSGSASDGTYRYQSTLSEGSHNYYFKFSDGVNPPVTLPTSGTYSGPTVTPGGAVPEFPLGLTLEMLFMPVVVYLLWRSRQRKKSLP